MSDAIRIALIGDHDPAITAHRAIPIALGLAAQAANVRIKPAWVATPAPERDAALLGAYHAIWCVPGSPYASMGGALAAIRFARENRVPFLGTCGGFQHALIEYARDVLGLIEADHAESNPEAAMPLIAPLACSLAESFGEIALLDGTRARAIYGCGRVVEGFNCNFGVNPAYRDLLTDGHLRVSGVDANDEVRVVELSEHPFFVATLFQPERSALRNPHDSTMSAGTSERAHPLIAAFVQAAVSSASILNPRA
jgi:CTP synthase (UTP-ammonia lyase)